MTNSKIINKVAKFTESITGGNDFNKTEIKRILNLIHHSDRNLNTYKGILFVYNFYRFKQIPQKKFENLCSDKRFIKCVSLLDGNILSPSEIGDLFLNILTIPSKEAEYRDLLLGSFYGPLWPLMNNHKNFKLAIAYGIEIVKSAFSLDKFDLYKKIKLKRKDAKIINLAGSGKKEIKLLNISSIAAIITATVGKEVGENIVVVKTISKATSSVTGSGDIFELIGVNLNLPIEKMADIAFKTKLGVFDINEIVPRLNRVYDCRLYNVQVFAGLVGGAAIVNPVDSDLINYGLTRGSTKLCLAILNKLYPEKNILVLQGKSPTGESVIDQVSIAADTEIAQNIQGQAAIKKVTPQDFGFDFKPFKYIKTKQSSGENLNEFIKVLAGQGNEYLKQAIAMEVALNLFGLGVVNDLKEGGNLALQAINSGNGIKIIKDLVIRSGGDIQRFNNLVNI